MLNIYTEYAWENHIDDMYYEYRPWHDLGSKFEVTLPEDKVKHREVEIQHWLSTSFNYDIQCIIKNEKRDLTKQELANIRVNVTKKHATVTKRVWGVKREVPNSKEEIEKYIEGAIDMAKRYTVDVLYSFYFLSDEDAMAFKLRWS